MNKEEFIKLLNQSQEEQDLLELQQENKQLKQQLEEERNKNKKAIEYIKKIPFKYIGLGYGTDLLEILGEDDE